MSAAALCVYCRRLPAADPHRPFCSARCRMADLGRWLGGDYRIPGTPALGSGDASPAADRDATDPEERPCQKR